VDRGRTGGELDGGRSALLSVLRGVHLHRVFGAGHQGAHLKLSRVAGDVADHWGHCRTTMGKMDNIVLDFGSIL